MEHFCNYYCKLLWEPNNSYILRGLFHYHILRATKTPSILVKVFGVQRFQLRYFGLAQEISTRLSQDKFTTPDTQCMVYLPPFG